jgi:radical SAM protein with 4Fe4S-binding SPASM domain
MHRIRHPEMTTDQVRSILDEITEEGCLFLLITGGEPLFRKDFTEIYRHAKENGLLVIVFSNGTLITDQILDLLADLPPQKVEISLYGATADTYEKITNVKGSYERCLQGIQRLLDRRIKVGLKTILMTHNRHEFFEIENLAKELGVKFRFDPVITPRFDGDKRPSLLRVPPEEAIEKEFSNQDRRQEWHGFFERFRYLPESDLLYPCRAGQTYFHIDPYGNLQPCLMTKKYQYNLSQKPFREWWYEAVPAFREKKINIDHACRGCEKISICGYCPALFQLENGEEEIRSEYVCKLGYLRYQALADGG